MPGTRPGPAIEKLELRPIEPGEQAAFTAAIRRAFGSAPPREEELSNSRPTFEFDRTLAAFDQGAVVATAGIFSFEMTVPGGSLPCGGVTRVTVQTTHRRRGLLTSMMRRQLEDIHERAEPIAALYASEAEIYGRFGYGLATYETELEVDARARFRETATPDGRIRSVETSEAIKEFARLWNEAAPSRPGMLRHDERWFTMWLADLDWQRNDASPHYRVVYERDGKLEGFALYRLKISWEGDQPNGTVFLESLIAATSQAYAGLWRYCLDIDLTTRVHASRRAQDEPLRFLLTDSRQPKTQVIDGIWLRLVDVAAALERRRYRSEGRLVLQVRDAFCPWNDGSYELVGGPAGGQCRPVTSDADLALDAADLGAVYLGGNRFSALAAAGRVEEKKTGAIARADVMFASPRAPWCPSHF